MNDTRKKYILSKTKSALELVSINGLNITNIFLVNYGSNFLIENKYLSPSINTLRFFLTIGILSVNLSYTNYNIYKNRINNKEKTKR